MRIAVIGTGISGALAARLLSTSHDVTVFEANDYAGGHTHTVDVSLAGTTYPVDTGFMVFNQRTYPNFCRLLSLLEVPSRPSDMSFSVRCSRSGWEYQGSSLNGIFAQRLNAVRPSFLRMLADINKFNRRGRQAASAQSIDPTASVGDFLAECGVGAAFVERYLIPMAAAIWSSEPARILDFPAQFMIGFFANHGLMQLRDRPQWRTIIGGSRRYMEALLDPIRSTVRLNCPVESVRRGEQEVTLTHSGGADETFDQVVFASHADQTLEMLSDATSREQQILSAFPYQPNEAVLHTDSRLLPRRRHAWASWNYHIPRERERAVSVTYDLSRLQGHSSEEPILLTLNDAAGIDPDKIIKVIQYHHPAFGRESLAAQQRVDEISCLSTRTHFCGAYWRFGFHEDGVRSALRVAQSFGIQLDACTAASTKESSLTAGISP